MFQQIPIRPNFLGNTHESGLFLGISLEAGFVPDVVLDFFPNSAEKCLYKPLLRDQESRLRVDGKERNRVEKINLIISGMLTV